MPIFEKPQITEPQPVKLGVIPAAAEIIYHFDGYIYVADSDGEQVTQITFDLPRSYEHVAVSPDRRFIAANIQLPNPNADPGGHSQVWLFDLENSTQVQLVPAFDSAGNGGVDWDHTGFVYFVAKETDVIENPQSPSEFIQNAVANDVYKVRYDGTGLMRLTDSTDGGEADVGVSPDGTLVSYIKEVIDLEKGNHTEIWVMNTDGSDSRLIYVGGIVKIGSVHDPEISSDNTQIAFSKVNPDFKNFPEHPAANTAHDLYIIQMNGTDLTRLTQPGPISIIPNWKDHLVIYTELNDTEQYIGVSMVNGYEIDQRPKRIRVGGNMANWMP